MGHPLSNYIFATPSILQDCLFNDSRILWRRHVGIEPTQDALAPNTGFEDQEAHQSPFYPLITVKL